MELKDTVNMMLSDDYKERFKAEFIQIYIRRMKLAKMIDDARNGSLKFKLSSDMFVYCCQVAIMDSYMNILLKRAIDENIILPTATEIVKGV
jgi:hypothetical protein